MKVDTSLNLELETLVQVSLDLQYNLQFILEENKPNPQWHLELIHHLNLHLPELILIVAVYSLLSKNKEEENKY